MYIFICLFFQFMSLLWSCQFDPQWGPP